MILMNWKKEFHQKFTSFCQKFKYKYELKKKIDNFYDSYENITLHEFKITYDQRRKAAMVITLIYLVLINLLYLIFSFSLYYFFIFVSLGCLIYLNLLDYHKKLIQKKDFLYANKYKFLSLQIEIILLSLTNNEDKNSIILEILENSTELGVNLRSIISDISLGKNFKRSLNKVIFYSPSFNHFFKDLIDSDFNFEISKNIDSFHDFYEKKFEIFINSLDTRLSLFFFFNLFFPITFLFTSSINSFNFSQLFSMIFFFILIETLFMRKILNEDIQLIGGINSQKFDEKLFFNVFLKFFFNLSFYLYDCPPELAIYKSILKLTDKEKSILNLNRFNYSIEFTSLNSFLGKIFNNFNSNSIQIFFSIMNRIFRIDSSLSPQLFKEMSQIIKKHIDLGKKQEIAYKSSFLKVIIFKFLLSFILGILTPLIYRFQEVYQVFNSILNFDENLNIFFSFNDYLITILFSLAFILITIHSFNKIYYFSKFKKQDYYVIVLYFICILISNFLWQSLIIF